MLYKHWKKIAIALTGFFWASCDESSSDPISVNETDTSSSITEGNSSSSNGTSGNEVSSSGETTSTASNSSNSNSGVAKSSSSGKVTSAESNSSHLDEPVDLYGCPSDICGPFTVDTMVALYGVIAAKYGVVAPIEPDSLGEIIAKYGVSSKTACKATQNNNGNMVYKCEDGVTCEEETTTEKQPLPCEGDVCPKYGVVKISKKTYTCSNGQVYNEAEFQMYYDAPVNKQDN